MIGRTKLDSIELEHKPTDSHVGTMFVGFSADQRRLQSMLRAWPASAARDAPTRYARALTGAYYFVPSIDDLADNIANGHQKGPS